MTFLEQRKNTKELDSTEQLARRCQVRRAGWEMELSRWLETQRPWLLRRCTSRLRNASDAEDAVQEITVKVMRSIGQFEGRSQLRTWLIRITDNHCYSKNRKAEASDMSDFVEFSIQLVEGSHDQATAEQMEIALQNDAQVQSVLSTLSPKNQDVIRLRFFAELSLQEISHVLNLSLSATKMRLYRAMETFRTEYTLRAEHECDFP